MLFLFFYLVAYPTKNSEPRTTQDCNGKRYGWHFPIFNHSTRQHNHRKQCKQSRQWYQKVNCFNDEIFYQSFIDTHFNKQIVIVNFNSSSSVCSVHFHFLFSVVLLFVVFCNCFNYIYIIAYKKWFVKYYFEFSVLFTICSQIKKSIRFWCLQIQLFIIFKNWVFLFTQD